MDTGWRFALGHPFDHAKDFDHATGYFSYLAKAGFGDGPAAPKFNDAAWRKLDLPHDWAVELPFSPNGSASHGLKALGRNFPENSLGWYRKTFFIPEADLGRRISVEFDGIYRDSIVWVNGFYLGRQPSGYTSFRYDLTDYLNYGGENVISVRVDASMEEGWFYEGAGIYRHVWLTKTAPLHVSPWGTYVTTEIGNKSADVTVRTAILNERTDAANFDLEQQIIDDSGCVVARAKISKLSLASGLSMEVPAVLKINNPMLWSVEAPVLHKLVTTISSGGNTIDRYETTFGLRTTLFDPDKGFFLNGRRVELKGTNNHQDHAGVGVALPDSLQDYRIRRLKEMGSNAYRSSHNPPTPEFLDACDRLGMLVIDENRLMGPSPEQLGQLEQMIRRDRNHPSVILWSLGNEEWAIEGNIKGARIASSMQAFAKRLDPTRKTVVAISGGWGGISSTIDVAGFNYIKQANTDKQHAEYPHQPGVGTEETTTQGTRGIYFDNRELAHWSPQKEGTSGGNAESGWQYYAARPYLAGIFYWTGFDYRGEMVPFGWPAVSSQFGILDTCGFPKDCFYYLKSWWSDEPLLHVFPHWNWAGKEGHAITVTANSNHEEVELLLNGQSLGKKSMPVNGHLDWEVKYQPGTLQARGYRRGVVVETQSIETTGQPAAVRINPDRLLLKADGRDVSVIAVEITDSQGRIVPTANDLVTFEVDGPARLSGVGNGNPSSHEPDQFLETVSLVTVENWRGRIAPATTQSPVDAEPQKSFTDLGNWLAPLPAADEVYELSGTFTLNSALATDAKIGIFLPAFGRKNSVWVNGIELARDLDTSNTNPGFELDPGKMRMGVNRVQLIVTPFIDKKNHIPELTRTGSVQIRIPAAPWQRRVFNGRAQLIVQGTHEAGSIRIRAHAENLQPTEVLLKTKPVAIAAEVP